MQQKKLHHELNEQELAGVSGGASSDIMDTWLSERIKRLACPKCQRTAEHLAETLVATAEIHAYEKGKGALVTITCVYCEYKFLAALAD